MAIETPSPRKVSLDGINKEDDGPLDASFGPIGGLLE